jgi:hypothetical protein
MNLEQLRKQAKELVKAARSGEREALDRLEGREPILANAQLVLARENGYASWPALVAAAEASVEAFVEAATSGRRDRADRLLAARPEIERDPWARLVLGRGWDGDPNRPGGPLNWAPILYVCHSVYERRARRRGCWRAAPTPTRRSRTSTARCRPSTGRRASSTTRS